eukprot:CAMPEP_0194601900 /NCGR_PEP_ID=MMETSP0292-20121207/29320_1 /TAXON_ID=39354 /ORGANISM="Heterosigma akashiwo, Strain CCMP2393" /LENGTH=30 /DNA_ID= /DNA_START= /DNA_END= /DNA_ORIENTATION=
MACDSGGGEQALEEPGQAALGGGGRAQPRQ